MRKKVRKIIRKIIHTRAMSLWNGEHLPKHVKDNDLNNALEACRRQKEGRKFIELSAYRRQNMFFIIVKNSFDGKLVRSRSDGRLLTTKLDSKNHGLGLRNIEVCAEKYYGKTEVTVRENEFELAVMLQERIE